MFNSQNYDDSFCRNYMVTSSYIINLSYFVEMPYVSLRAASTKKLQPVRDVVERANVAAAADDDRRAGIIFLLLQRRRHCGR